MATSKPKPAADLKARDRIRFKTADGRQHDFIIRRVYVHEVTITDGRGHPYTLSGGEWVEVIEEG